MKNILFLESIIDLCSNTSVLKVFKIIKTVFLIIRISAIILLLISLMYSFAEVITNKSEDALSKTLTTSVVKIVTVILIILMPTFINLITSLASNDSYISCWNIATSENIDEIIIEEAREALAKAQETRSPVDIGEAANLIGQIEDEDIKEELSNQLNEIDSNIVIPDNSSGGASKPNLGGNIGGGSSNFVVGGQKINQYSSKKGSLQISEYNGINGSNCVSSYCTCPKLNDKVSSFKFKLNSGTKVMSTRNWTNGSPFVSMKYKCNNGITFDIGSVHNVAVDNYENAFARLCQLVTTGINGYKYEYKDEYNYNSNPLNSGKTPIIVLGNGQYGKVINQTINDNGTNISMPRHCSRHAYGLAIDIIANYTIYIDGEKYTPYWSGSVAKKTENYKNFVDIGLNGNEWDYRNVNFILWKYVFEPAGFEWGGNWTKKGQNFDPMHFELYY